MYSREEAAKRCYVYVIMLVQRRAAAAAAVRGRRYEDRWENWSLL